MQWSLIPSGPFTGLEGESYKFDVHAMLPDSVNTSLLAFSVTIKLVGCGDPTVITPVSPP